MKLSYTRRPWAAFDGWLNRGPFVARDLGIFRVIAAVALLATQRSFSYIDQFPSSLYSPPPGPFQLLPGLPPHGFLAICGILLTVATLLMGVGLATRWASLAVTLISMVELGYSYSFGKIDHSIILAIAPGILSFANWGASFSIDALLRARRRPGRPRAEIRQWPIRIFALSISVSFATAAISKIRTGWFSPASQVVKGYAFRYYFTGHNHNFVSDIVTSVQAPWAWEIVDWLVVFFELGMAIAFVSWGFLRIMVSIAALFHLGVFLLLGIDFEWDVIGYGAFVSWGSVPWPRLSPGWRRALVVTGIVLISFLALNTGLAMVGTPVLHSLSTGLWIIGAGALIGFGYLLSIAIRVLRRTRFPAADWADAPQATRGWVRIALRVAVALILVSLPLTYYVRLTDAEPYPALFQPDFNGPGPLTNARVHQSVSVITVTFTDGTTTHVPSTALLASHNVTGTDQLLEFEYLFRNNPKGEAPATRAWLAGILDARFAPRVASRMYIQWVTVKYDHISGKVTDREVVGHTVIPLPNAG